MKDARGHGSNTRGAGAAAPAASTDLGKVDSGGIWSMQQDATGNVTATHANGTVIRGSRSAVYSQVGRYGMQQAMARVAGGSHAVAQKHGISTGHLFK